MVLLAAEASSLLGRCMVMTARGAAVERKSQKENKSTSGSRRNQKIGKSSAILACADSVTYLSVYQLAPNMQFLLCARAVCANIARRTLALHHCTFVLCHYLLLLLTAAVATAHSLSGTIIMSASAV